jgi:hypothetical protein
MKGSYIVFMISEYLEIKAQEQIMTTEKLNTNIHMQHNLKWKLLNHKKLGFAFIPFSSCKY